MELRIYFGVPHIEVHMYCFDHTRFPSSMAQLAEPPFL